MTSFRRILERLSLRCTSSRRFAARPCPVRVALQPMNDDNTRLQLALEAAQIMALILTPQLVLRPRAHGRR
jgi:hypothetical protein